MHFVRCWLGFTGAPWQAIRLGLVGLVLAVVALLPATAVKAADDFLPPEKAFVVTGRMVASDRAEVSVHITPGYYVYREPFRFKAAGASVGDALIPAGKVKFDENFQKNVETYRGDVRITLPVLEALGPWTLDVVTQGCAEAGLCYPPMTTHIALDPARIEPLQATTDAGLGSPPSADDSFIERVLRSGQIWRVIGAFFGLGLLLCLTPCVLPMLPILSSLIVGGQGCSTRARGLALASAYSLGMALVFTAMGVAAGLAGEGIGARMQTPWAIAGFSMLLVLLSLSMFDLYQLQLPARWTTHLTHQSNKLPAGRLLGVFVMGGVSALIVSPCVTAPLAAALLFISQSGDVVMGGAALFAMACGMSVPLLALGASAGRWIPQAGTWMHGIKKLFGVLMLAVALWLAQPILPIAAMLVGWGLLLILSGMLLWPVGLHHHHRHALHTTMQRVLGLAALVLGVAQLVGAVSGAQDPLRPLAALGGQPPVTSKGLTFQHVGSEAELDAALQSAGGRLVMLDFYADWCVSCKEMERFTFKDASVAARLDRALLLKADVTANDENHRLLLKRFKLFGPPGTLFFDATGHEVAAARVVGFQSARRFEQTLDRAGL
jgi:thiol:disulfide interchange protein DsbD